MRRAALILAIGLLVLPTRANADDIKVGWYSQQVRPSHAAMGARIQARRADHRRAAVAPQRPALPTRRQGEVVRVPVKGGTDTKLEEPYPRVRANDPVLRSPNPAGPDSFWYPDGEGHLCIYKPDSVLPCVTVVAPAGAPGPAVPSPIAIAASLARRVDLSPGEIAASPARAGLTGAESWFWLDPPPRRTQLSISLVGERVTVIADPATVTWTFGDGEAFDAGPGIPYQAGAVPAASVRHRYETRCLPGDRGRNPYVLGTCGAAGYRLTAVILWRITFAAVGPIDASGALPSRTTEASSTYPVSEARAFLVRAGSL